MNKVLNIEQKDFICRQLAQFVPHKKIADIFLEHFPETKMGKEELVARVKYISSHPSAKQWQERTNMYRSMLNTGLKKEFEFTHRFKRIHQLERIVKQASTPKLTAVFSCPESRDDQGRLTYSRNEIYRADYVAALRAIAMINRELENAGELDVGEQFSQLNDKQLKDRIEIKQNIITEFGPIQLNEDEAV